MNIWACYNSEMFPLLPVTDKPVHTAQKKCYFWDCILFTAVHNNILLPLLMKYFFNEHN